MKKTKFLFFACLIISMAVFTIAPAFAQLGDITLPPTPTPPPVVEPTPVPTPTPPPVVEPTPPPVVQQIITPPSDTTPPVVSGVLNTSVSDIAATIVWTTNELAISHLEYGTTSSYGSSATLPATALLAHTGVITGLMSGTTYYYCIHATDLAGNTANDCGHSVTTQASVDATPPVASLITTASVNSNQVTVTWTTDEAANSQVEYGMTSSYGQSTTLDSSLGTTHSVTISGLTANTEYHFRIKTADNSGNTTTSGDNTFTTAAVVSSGSSIGSPSPVPSTPSVTLPVISVVETTEVSPTSQTITWVTDVPADSQIVYGTTSGYGQSTTLNANLATLHSVTLTNLAPNTLYHYTIQSKNALGNSATAADYTFTTQANVISNNSLSVNATPPQISIISSVSLSPTTTEVTWTTDKLASSQVEYGTSSSYGSSTTLDASLGLTHTVLISGLTSDTEYHFCVKSTDASANLSVSGDESFMTAALPASVSLVNPNPSSPSVTLPVVSGIVETEVSSTSETIAWTTDLPADSQIEYGLTTSYGQSTSLDSTLVNTHSATLTNLTPNTTYHYQVKSKTVAGNYAVVADGDFTTLQVSIPAPTISAVASQTTSNSATVTWTTDVPANSQIEYGLNSAYDSQTTVDETLVTTHSVTISNLASNTTYDFRVTSENATDDLSLSVNHTFTTASLSGNAPSNSAPAEILPNIITNLRVSDVETSAVTLNFTVPNTPTNEALQYDIRYSISPITDSNFSSAVPVQDTPIYYDFPEIGASVEDYYVVLQLNAATQYYFAIKTKDQTGNTSAISNVVSGTTLNAAASSSGSVGSSSGSTGGSSGSANGGGGGGGSSSGSVIVSPPKDLRAEALDTSAALSWTNPTDTNFVRVKVLRKTTGYPTSVTDGQAIYEGSSFHYIDTNLTNGQKYFYSIFSLNHLSNISASVQFSVTPQGGTEQVDFINIHHIASCGITQDLRYGMNNDQVKQFQQYLVLVEGNIYPQKLVTGYFGSYTRSAVRSLQAKYGIPQTGVWDQATRDAVHMCLNTPAQTAPVSANASLSRDLSIGSRGADVSFLQQYLVNLKLLDPKYLTGYFGQFTKASIIKLQQNNNIQPANGTVGTDTRNLILKNK